jgi:hypothetical protein
VDGVGVKGGVVVKGEISGVGARGVCSVEEDINIGGRVGRLGLGILEEGAQMMDGSTINSIGGSFLCLKACEK